MKLFSKFALFLSLFTLTSALHATEQYFVVTFIKKKVVSTSKAYATKEAAQTALGTQADNLPSGKSIKVISTQELKKAKRTKKKKGKNGRRSSGSRKSKRKSKS